MLSFATIIEDGHPSFRLKSILILLSFIFAWLSYRFIELPIRFGHLTKVSFLKLLLPISLLGLVGLITYFYDGLWFRKNATLVGYLGDTDHRSFHRYVEDKFYPCSPSFLAKEAPKWEGFTRCAQTKRHETIDVALIGDSHAEHLFIGLAEQLKDLNLAFYIKFYFPQHQY